MPSAAYEAEVEKKAFTQNVIVLIELADQDVVLTMREADDGPCSSFNARTQTQYDGVVTGIKISPSSIDARTVQTGIRSFEFGAIDKDLFLTELCENNFTFFTGCKTRIFIGRSGVSLGFADYYELPVTRIKEAGFSLDNWTFKSEDALGSLRTPFQDEADALAGLIFAGSTTFTAQGDVSDFPSSGMVKIDEEFISYSALNTTTKVFTVSARGALGSEAAQHEIGASIQRVTHLTGNPCEIFLDMCLTSLGASSFADLIDEADITTLQTESFSGVAFEYYVNGTEDLLTWFQENLLNAMNCRLVTSSNNKLTLKLLDNNSFDVSQKTFDASSIIPNSVKMTTSNSKIINVIHINYDFNDGTQAFGKLFKFEDEISISTYGRSKPFVLNLKGVKAALDGAAYVEQVARRIAARFGTATPKISLKTHMDKSLAITGEVVRLEYNLPTPLGDRNFENDLEIMQSALDTKTGLVDFGLEFTAYTGLRNAYISPSDTPIDFDVLAQSVTLPAGRGAFYKVGWMMQFYELSTHDLVNDPNEITAIDGDTLFFANPIYGFVDQQGMRFADYDDATDDQKRYAFISDGTNNFADGKPPYAILF